jgi:hypothetical protein
MIASPHHAILPVPVETLVTGSYVARRRALPMRVRSVPTSAPGVLPGVTRLRALALCDELIPRLQLQQCRSHLLLQINQFGNLLLQTTNFRILSGDLVFLLLL